MDSMTRIRAREDVFLLRSFTKRRYKGQYFPSKKKRSERQRIHREAAPNFALFCVKENTCFCLHLKIDGKRAFLPIFSRKNVKITLDTFSFTLYNKNKKTNKKTKKRMCSA